MFRSLTAAARRGSVNPMSITVELPPDIEAQVRTIPDLDQRMLSFLRSQVEYEKWRKGRYSEKARSIVSEGLADAERMPAAGVSREEMFRRLFAVVDEIAPQN
jgi:hypothetical protein